jgi:hypothetical protein
MSDVPLAGDGDVIYLNWTEMMRLSRKLSVQDMGNVIREICTLHEEGLLSNGPVVRVDAPINGWEATDGTQAR